MLKRTIIFDHRHLVCVTQVPLDLIRRNKADFTILQHLTDDFK